LHKRAHSSERPYACDEPGCDFRATQAGTLKVHKRAHTGERPYPCDEPGCMYRATQKGDIKRHTRTHTGERPYPCDEAGCEFWTAHLSALARHKRAHRLKRARDEGEESEKGEEGAFVPIKIHGVRLGAPTDERSKKLRGSTPEPLFTVEWEDWPKPIDYTEEPYGNWNFRGERKLADDFN
jgi:hypothetical protein